MKIKFGNVDIHYCLFGISICLSMIAYTLKEYDKAIEYMERAFTEHDNVLTWMNVSSIFSFVRTDEKFRPYLERMHFLV